MFFCEIARLLCEGSLESAVRNDSLNLRLQVNGPAVQRGPLDMVRMCTIIGRCGHTLMDMCVLSWPDYVLKGKEHQQRCAGDCCWGTSAQVHEVQPGWKCALRPSGIEGSTTSPFSARGTWSRLVVAPRRSRHMVAASRLYRNSSRRRTAD